MSSGIRSYRLRRPVADARVPALKPSDVAALYHLERFYDQGIYGRGIGIGFIEFALPSTRDDAVFWSRYSIRPDLNTAARATLLPRMHPDPSALDETDLDLQYAGALAPGADLRVYVIDPTLQLAAFLPALWGALRAAAADGVRIVSISLGGGDAEVACSGQITGSGGGTSWADPTAFAAALDAWVREQGMLCFVSSGDNGAYASFPSDTTVQASWPATQGAFIAVGGTQLAVPGEPASGEEAWGGQTQDPSGPEYNPANTLGQASGGGGASIFVPAPQYQAALGADLRLTPDVAAFAGPLVVVDRGVEIPVWGTSASAPIVAAIAALYRQASGRALDHTTLYGCARDVLDGNNWNVAMAQAELPVFATAAPGYDPCTGMGTPDAALFPGM